MSDPERPPNPLDETPGPGARPLPAGSPKRPEDPGKPAPDDAGPSGVPEAPPADQKDPHGDDEDHGS
ncbi:hypothetical protein GCM10011322_42760 [Salinarimonas ramus]|uniref:Uncharacterized protein n=1 Tax=Salinarimonas ramus TaxID=690164 RepID=A0A917V8T6_9HYPH|nr:hypothetical protein GCM10011322_42760 [Salinarimonas ramus]